MKKKIFCFSVLLIYSCAKDGLDGANGIDGINGLDGTSIGMITNQLENGCSELVFYNDENNNNKFDNESVISRVNVCDGQQGEKGSRGEEGQSVGVFIESATSEQCPNSTGFKINVFNDSNEDSVLNNGEEIVSTSVVCIPKYTISISNSEGGTTTGAGEYMQGSLVNLNAIPNEGYKFVKWSNGSTVESLTITVSEDLSLEAIFDYDCNFWQYDVPDWKKTSYELFDIIYPENYQQAGNLLNNYWGNESGEYGFNVIVVDYNNDGYRDIIGFYNDYTNFVDYPDYYLGYERKKMIRFYKGTCGGNFIIDNKNDNKFLGSVHGRKILLGDFNDDGYVDVFFVSHGYDRKPFNGEFNKAIFSDGNGGFYDEEYSGYVSFYHGGATGDIDNDGDLDIVVVEGGRGRALVFINNNGVLTPSTDLIDQNLGKSMYNAEMFDLNEDGYLDLILGGHDWYGLSSTYNTLPLIIYGDGQDFIDNQYQRLPKANVEKQGLVSNFEFYDLNSDGKVEIILTRTGDALNPDPDAKGEWLMENFYKNWSIQVLEFNGQEYVDRTEKFIDVYYGTEPWIKFTKIRDKDNDGIMEMFNNSNPYNDDLQNYLEWKIIGGKLIKQ